MRATVPLAIGGALALALIPALPAAAAAKTWISPTDSAWSSATWSPAGAPAAGDDITFAGGDRSTYDLGNVPFGSLTFTNTHTIANGGGAIGLGSGGISVQAGEAAIEPQLDVNASQTWRVAAGAGLTLPSQVNVTPSGTLTLDIDGGMTVSTGNLDAAVTGCIVKTGTGTLQLWSGGGSVGSCGPGLPAGLRVAEGEVHVRGGANLGGKAFLVDGGTLTGGVPTPAVVNALSLAPGGTVSPGGAGGSGIGHLDLWGTSAWTGGTYLVDWDPGVTGVADLVHGAGQAISVSGTQLDIRLDGLPTAGETITVIDSDVAVTGAIDDENGDPVADGGEFISRGQVFAVHYEATSIDIEWLRVAPEPTTPPSPGPSAGPAAPTLPDTGLGMDAVAPLGVAAIVALVAGAAALAIRRTPRRQAAD